MKKINFVLILWALIAVSGRCYGQSVFENIEYFPNDGEDEIESSLNLSTDLQGMAQRFTPSGSSLEETKYKSRHLLNLLGKDKIKTSFWAKMNREQRLTDHANLKLHYKINDEKIEMQNYYNRMGNLRSNDQLIAKAWEKSPTGRRDGRYWDELSDGEKEVMRTRYIRHHNPKVFEENYSPGLVIPESEYAMAWKLETLARVVSKNGNNCGIFKPRTSLGNAIVITNSPSLPLCLMCLMMNCQKLGRLPTWEAQNL